MERKDLEIKVKKIISIMKNPKIEAIAENAIKTFSDADLEKLLVFLETGDKSMLLKFISEKTKDAMGEVQVVKLAKGKIIIGKNSRIEKAERIEEEKELENLLNQL